MSWKDSWSILKQSGQDFVEDEAMSRAAALAFYTALAIAPILLLLLSIASFLPDSTQEKLIERVESMASADAPVGSVESVENQQVTEGLRTLIEQAKQRQQEMASGSIAMVISILTLVFSASALFAQLQTSLNRMWDVRVKPGRGVIGFLRKRLISFGMILAVFFIMLVSLVISAAISLIVPGSGALWDLLNWLISFAVFTFIFAAIFKYLPDVKIEWRDVWVGAAITALLFALGKYAIGLYLGHKSFSSSYGAAGSLIALLAWVYYSSIIIFFGAEVTHAVARRYGSGIQPDKHAIRTLPQRATGQST